MRIRKRGMGGCILALLAAGLLLSLSGGRGLLAKEQDIYKSLDVMCDVIAIIQRDYIEPISSAKLMQDAVAGMLASLDSYSHFIPASARETPNPAPTAADGGTYGMEVASKDRMLTVVAPIEGGPAWKSGVKSGDIIVKIDDEAIEERPLVDLLHLLRSRADKQIRVQVVRRGERDFLDFTIKPGKIEGPAARCEMLEEKVGVLRISRFDADAPPQVAECLKKLAAEGGRGTVIDLRDCPAGDMRAGIAVAELFLPSGELITSLAGRAKGMSREFRSEGRPLASSGPFVALVNGGTSGAAEVLAGALQSRGKTILMGQKTFGCAFEESAYPLKDGSSIAMISAVYRTPEGLEIQDEGLPVDVDVPLPAPPEEGEKPKTAERQKDRGQKGVRERKEKKETKENKDKGGSTADPMVQRAVDLIKGIRIITLQGGA